MSKTIGYDGLLVGVEYATSGGPPEIYLKTKCPMTGGNCTSDCRLSKNGKCIYEESLKDDDLYRKIDNVIYDSAKTIGDKKKESEEETMSIISSSLKTSPHSRSSSYQNEHDGNGKNGSSFENTFAPPDSHSHLPGSETSGQAEEDLDSNPHPFQHQSSTQHPVIEQSQTETSVEGCSTESGVLLHPNVTTPTLKNIEDEIDKW